MQGASQTQEEIAMKKSFAHICLVVTFLGLSVAYANSAVAQTLASGSFLCVVEQIDPPSGVPFSGANVLW